MSAIHLRNSVSANRSIFNLPLRAIVLAALCLLAPAFVPAQQAVFDRTPPKPDDSRIQRRPTSPTYAIAPAYAHAQCANSCQVSFDREVGSCYAKAVPGSALFACIGEQRKLFLACVNACPVEAGRVK
jgi:hypothetical protein